MSKVVRICAVLALGVALLGLAAGGCNCKGKKGAPAEPAEPAEEAVEAAEAATPEEPAAPVVPVVKGGGDKGIPKPSQREVDRAVSGWLGQDVGAGRHDDVDPDAAWRIDLVQAEGASYAGTIEVDLDRDGQVDEEWSVDGSSLTRQSSPDDDGNRSKRHAWIMGSWVGM